MKPLNKTEISWLSICMGILVFNALVGIFILERTWKRVSRFRNPPSMELEELFSAHSRKDALNWKRWKLYPGAMFFLVPRMVFCLVSLLLCVLCTKIFLCGHKQNVPLHGCRKKMINWSYNFFIRIFALFGLFTWHTHI